MMPVFLYVAALLVGPSGAFYPLPRTFSKGKLSAPPLPRVSPPRSPEGVLPPSLSALYAGGDVSILSTTVSLGFSAVQLAVAVGISSVLFTAARVAKDAEAEGLIEEITTAPAPPTPVDFVEAEVMDAQKHLGDNLTGVGGAEEPAAVLVEDASTNAAPKEAEFESIINTEKVEVAATTTEEKEAAAMAEAEAKLQANEADEAAREKREEIRKKDMEVAAELARRSWERKKVEKAKAREIADKVLESPDRSKAVVLDAKEGTSGGLEGRAMVGRKAGGLRSFVMRKRSAILVALLLAAAASVGGGYGRLLALLSRLLGRPDLTSGITRRPVPSSVHAFASSVKLSTG